MTYPEKVRAIADTFERQLSMLGKPYALQELRNALNGLSNEALQEMQNAREGRGGLLDVARAGWKEGERK